MDNSVTTTNRRGRERGLGSKQNGSKDVKLDFHEKRAAYDFPRDPCWEASIQDLPIPNEKCPHQSSKESSDEEWSDFSFYDLPETLKDSFHKSVHLAEHMIPTHMVSRPPYHATAKAHRVHALLDTEVSNPFSIAMEDSDNQLLSQAAVPQNSNQTTEITTTGGNSTTTGFQGVIPSNKAFDGSLFYRHSDLKLSGKQRKETRSERLQQNGGHAVSNSNASSLLSQASVKGYPDIRVVPSEVSVHKQVKTGQSGHDGVYKSENASYLERLKRSFPSNGSYTAGSSSQEILANKFMQRSREALLRREKQKDIPGSTFKKEHSPKSVSFANSVKGPEKQNKTSSSGKEEMKGQLRNRRPKEGHAQNGFPDQREHTVQSNVVLKGRLGHSFSVSGSHNSAVKRSFNQETRQEITVAGGNGLSKEGSKHGDAYDVALPPSPPTRDTNQTQRSSHLVQVLSLYGEHSLFESNLSRNLASPPRQSNVSLGFSGSKTLSGASLSSTGKSFVQQTNSKVDLSSRPYVMSGGLSRDNSLTIEELLSSGSVKSSPENSPPYRFPPQFEKSSKREHSLDDYLDKRGNLLQDLGVRNSFSMDTSQKISSALWASRTSSPNSYQELLLKGRLFRRWYQKTRLKRLIKKEDDVKLQSAVTFWQTEMQHRYFEAWKNARSVQLEKADKLRRKLMLQKGLTALRFAVSQHKQSVSEVQMRASARITAKYWLKWQKSVQMKETVRLREAFDKWHLFKMNQNRGAMMEQMADRHMLSKNYLKWKIRCDLEQKNGVASLHYKIGLLTRSWHSWRLYASQRVVKTRLKEVARVHYEEYLQARLFTVWKENTGKAVVADSLKSKRVLVKAFYCWKNWTQYAKVIRLRFQSMCKEYHRHKLVEQSFHHWKIRLMNRQADRRYRNGLQRKIFKLWFLRFKRKVIHRHLCKALAKKGKKRRFLNRWSNFTKQQRERRRTFVGSLERMLVSGILNNWRQHVKEKKALRSKELQLIQKKNLIASRKMMDRWLFAMQVANFRKKARVNWSRRCTRKACEAWKLLLKKKYLEQRLMVNRDIWQLLMMKRIFRTWKQQKRKVDTENEKVFRARAILSKNFKARVLQAWRVVNQEQQIISPMVARRERKEMARVFDAWRLHIHRQKNIVDQKTRATEKIVDKYFLIWRDRAYLRVKEREVNETLLRNKMSRAFAAWRGYIKDQRYAKLKIRARRFELMEKFYSLWKEKVQNRAEEKVEETGKEARGLLLVKWSFRVWRMSADRQRTYRLRQQEIADNFYRDTVTRKAWVVWLRRYRVEDWARDHARTKKEGFLRRTFQAWHRFTKAILQMEMQRFATSMSGLDSSFGSFSPSPFRQPLASTLGSTLGSTVSDVLTSSGYGASIRRGSGSVFTFGLALKERDDDTASLPGRIDGIDQLLRPESPIVRPISPISILRETRPMAPLAFNSSQTSLVPSPSPSPSPEHPLPSTPPIRLGDFSPVKSEDDTGIHSGSSESDHEDCDRMSTASCTSYTGRSTQSDPRDREVMATETILHWRNLPLSLTFRTWLKFTRQRKLQKELLNYITNNKTMELMAKTLGKWRRELYTKVTARQHWLDTSRLKYLKIWNEFAVTKRIQEERKVLAYNHCRLSRLKGGFQKWKEKCSAKKKLQELIGQWQKKAMVTEKDKGFTQVIQKKQNARYVRQTFTHWVQMTRKSQDARRLYTERLLPTCFKAWHALASTRVSNRKKVVLFEERRLLTMAFREWQARFQAISRVDEFIEIKEADRLLEILRVWHNWANGMNTRRKRSRLFRRSVELKITREIFNNWLTGAQQLQIAKRTHELHIMKCVYVGWRDVALERTRNKRAMREFKKNVNANLLARSFRFWQQLLAHSELSRAHTQHRDHNALWECFEEWRSYTLEIRADKFFVMAMQKKVFLCWYDGYTSRKTTRRLIHSWKSITEEAKVLNNRAMHLAEGSEKKLLRRMFNYWVQEAHKAQKAKSHASGKMTRRTFLGLHQYVQSRVEKRKILQELLQNKEEELVSNSFKTWRERFKRSMRNLEVLEEHLQKKESELLHYCLVKWVKFMLRRKAEKSYEKKLVHKCFSRWWFALYIKKGSEKLQEKILMRKTREAGRHWKQWTIKVKKQAEMADKLQTKHGRHLVHSYFVQWTEKTRQMQQAKDLHNRTVLKRSLVEWRQVSRSKIDKRKKIKSFQDQKMNKKVSRMFYDWREALKVVRKHQELIDGQMVHHNRRVKQGCLREWKKFTQKSRAEKHHSKTVISKFFTNWKARKELKQAEKEKAEQQEEIANKHYQRTLSKMCFRAWFHDTKLEMHNRKKEEHIVEKHFMMWKKRMDLNSIATEMVDRRVFEKFWTKWRHQLIRKRVSEMMMKHEDKKQLSEVFMAWYQLTLVRRRLLKGWQMYKTKKLFRLWMQKYNES